MQEQDLKQIKEAVRDVVKSELSEVKSDLGGVKSELSEVKNEFKKVNDKIDEILITSKKQFDDHTEQLEEIKKEIAKRPTIVDFESWREKKVVPLARDIDKLKYLHKKEWKKLPDSGVVSRALVEEGIKI